MNGMFEECSSLKELDLSNFFLKNGDNYDDMFKGCSLKLRKGIKMKDKNLLKVLPSNNCNLF